MGMVMKRMGLVVSDYLHKTIRTLQKQEMKSANKIINELLGNALERIGYDKDKIIHTDKNKLER